MASCQQALQLPFRDGFTVDVDSMARHVGYEAIAPMTIAAPMMAAMMMSGPQLSSVICLPKRPDSAALELPIITSVLPKEDS